MIIENHIFTCSYATREHIAFYDHLCHKFPTLHQHSANILYDFPLTVKVAKVNAPIL